MEGISFNLMRRNKQITNKKLLKLTKTGLSFLMRLSRVFSLDNTSTLLFFIKMNNIIVKANKTKYSPEDILILLPHCLQNSNCTYKVTGYIENCRKCMKCTIGVIRNIAEEHNITSVEVVSGGKSARNIIQRVKPRVIIAVACERDLISGINDIKEIPTIGILNKMPNGPCYNTSVDTKELDEAVKLIISRDEIF